MAIKIDYDVPKEMVKNRSKADKILNNFSDVEGLPIVLNQTLSLIDSDNMRVLCKSLISYVEKFRLDEFNINRMDEDSFAEKYPQLEYAQVLDRFKIVYVPSLWGDTILFESYTALNSFLTGILSMKKENNETCIDEVLNLLNKVMVLLDGFDIDESFVPPDQEFFIKLKKMKWGKNANKLLDKIFDIYTKIGHMIIETPTIDSHDKFLTNSRFSLIFLSACSAIHFGNSKMEVENVIHAYQVYYKLLDANISDLI